MFEVENEIVLCVCYVVGFVFVEGAGGGGGGAVWGEGGVVGFCDELDGGGHSSGKFSLQSGQTFQPSSQICILPLQVSQSDKSS